MHHRPSEQSLPRPPGCRWGGRCLLELHPASADASPASQLLPKGGPPSHTLVTPPHLILQSRRVFWGRTPGSIVQMRNLRLKKKLSCPRSFVSSRATIQTHSHLLNLPHPLLQIKSVSMQHPATSSFIPTTERMGDTPPLPGSAGLCLGPGHARERSEKAPSRHTGPPAPPQARCPPAQQAQPGDSAASGGDARAVTHLPRRAEPGTLPAPGQKRLSHPDCDAQQAQPGD